MKLNLREIDRLVAEKVMRYNLSGLSHLTIPYFSTNIADAWRVVEKMKRSNFSARHRFVTELQKEITPKELKDKNQLLDLGWMIFYLTPKAICLAALKVVGVKVEGTG